MYKQPIKKPRNYELLRELPLYDDINISRKERALRGYAKTYKVGIINNKNLSDSLPVSKNSIKNLFDELLREKRGFKYIIIVKITLKKRINDNGFDPKTLCFNSLVKTVINQRYRLFGENRAEYRNWGTDTTGLQTNRIYCQINGLKRQLTLITNFEHVLMVKPLIYKILLSCHKRHYIF